MSPFHVSVNLELTGLGLIAVAILGAAIYAPTINAAAVAREDLIFTRNRRQKFAQRGSIATAGGTQITWRAWTGTG